MCSVLAPVEMAYQDEYAISQWNRAYHWLLIDSDAKHLCSRFSHPTLDIIYKQGNVDYKTMGLPLSSFSYSHLHSIL